ncbi:MAG: hypothetical protein U0R18_19850 [Mycobacterium sp.]
MGKRLDKTMEWIRRYWACELAGWVGEAGGAALGYWLTGSLAAAAAVATVACFVTYYLPAYVNALRWSFPPGPGRLAGRAVTANAVAVRSLTVEFGMGEAVDSLAVRPALIYATPLWLDSLMWGWILGGFLADVVFYVFTIISYERFTRWVVRRPDYPRAVMNSAASAGAGPR